MVGIELGIGSRELGEVVGTIGVGNYCCRCFQRLGFLGLLGVEVE